MIVKALVKSFSFLGVTGYVYKDVNVPLQTMLNTEARPFERVDLGIDTLSMPLGNRSDAMDMKPLTLDVMPEGDRGYPGLLVSLTQAEALELIVDHWIVGGGGQCDAAVVQAREARAKGMPFLSAMGALLASERAGRRADMDDDSVVGIVWTEENFYNRFKAISRGRREAVLPEPDRWRTSGTMGVVMERDCKVGGMAIRRFATMVFFGDERSRRAMVSFGGEWQCESASRMDPAVIDAFDRKGRAVYFGEGDLTAWQVWKVALLVKVPAARGGPGSDTPPACLDGIPVGRLADVRLPIPLADSVRVVDDPVVARDILCRTSRGFVISGLGGDVVPQPVARLRGRWLALCVPSHWAVAA